MKTQKTLNTALILFSCAALTLVHCSGKEDSLSDETAVMQAKDALTITYASGDSAGSVTRGITLPTAGANEVMLTWASSNETAIDPATGAVTRPRPGEGNAEVTLTATLTKNAESDTKEFMLTVLAQPASDENDVTQAKAILTITYASGDSAGSVTQDIALPTTGENGVTITWASSDMGKVSNAGAVTRPGSGESNAEVTLTATLTKNAASDTKEFMLTVLAQPASDEDAVTQAMRTLTITYASGDSAGSVTQDIALPTEGSDGVAITWASSDMGRVSNVGAVTRPAPGESNAEVTLTATLTKNDATGTKTFTLTVLAQPVSDVDAVTQAMRTLTITYAQGDSAGSVTRDITLPTEGANEVMLTWASSNETAIDVTTTAGTGAVTRPAPGESNAELTLTATLTKNDTTAAKTFTLTVISQPFTWSKVTTSGTLWSARRDHAAVTFNGQMWVLGGATGSIIQLNDVWSSEDGQSWTNANARGPAVDPDADMVEYSSHWSARADHAAVVLGGKMWVLGGIRGTIELDDVWSSEDGTEWTQTTVSGTHWSARAEHAAVVFDGKMWVLGGSDGSTYFNDVWWSNDGENWTNANARGPAVDPDADMVEYSSHWSARGEHAAVVLDDKIWVLGGGSVDADGAYFNDVWWSSDGVNWTEATNAAGWLARERHAAVVFDNKIWVLGGNQIVGNQNDVWRSADGTTWEKLANGTSHWSRRENHAAVVLDDKIWLMGGFRQTGGRVQDVWVSQEAN